jgi:hypothetical protein
LETSQEGLDVRLPRLGGDLLEGEIGVARNADNHENISVLQ